MRFFPRELLPRERGALRPAVIAHEGFGWRHPQGAWRAAPRGGVRPRFFFASRSLQFGTRPLCGGRARGGRKAGVGGACGLEFLAEASDGALAPGATPLSVGSGQTHPFTDVMVFEELPVVEETVVVVAP